MQLLVQLLFLVLALLSPCQSNLDVRAEDILAVKHQFEKRGTPLHMSHAYKPYKREELQPQFFPQYNSKRVKLAYGPWSVPPMSEHNGMVDYLDVGAAMPCTNCTITFMHASLEYPNGTYANANTSIWLHHIVAVNLAKTDTVCGPHYYGQGQRWFASGNERTPVDFSRSGTMPTGYRLSPDSYNVILTELMNQGMHTQTVTPTITYEYIDGMPDGFWPLTPVWLDIGPDGGCQGSDQPPKDDGTFKYGSPAYTADFSGAVIGMGGHLHDGGTHLEIKKNNVDVCNSIAYYGQTPGYWDASGTSMTMPMNPMFSHMEHVSTMTFCYAPTIMINPGDKLNLTAYYNFTEWAPMLNTNGAFSNIMGIALVYVAEGMSKEKMESYVGSKVAPLAKVPEPTHIAAMDMNMDAMPQGSSMRMGGMHCVPSRDSPGTISTDGINMNNPRVKMDYLMAILNDTCLQVWSGPYARYFWYGIVTVIALATLTRLLQYAKLSARKRDAAANQSNSRGLNILFTPATAIAFRVIRAVSYPQVTPVHMPNILKIPAFGPILMMMAYFGFLLALEFLNVTTGDDQTYQSMSVRAAWLSVTQVPLLVLLANKRNLIGLFTGVTFERLNVLHRWVARGLLLTTSMHFGFESYGWARAGVMQLEWSTDTCPPTGIAAYSLVLWMNLTTLAPFRNLSYEFFVLQHILTFMGTIIAIAYHIPTTAPYARTYIFIASALYLVSRIFQTLIYLWYNVCPARATITSVSDAVTKVTLRHPSVKSWTPGSHILLGIPRYGLLQSHPATISSTPASHDGEMIFYLLRRRGFTKRISRGSSQDRSHAALIDGPYGGKQSDFGAYHTAVLIAGSTGITFTLPILLDLAARASTTRLPLRSLHFVWASKDAALVAALGREIGTALAALRSQGIAVSAHAHVTAGGALPPASTAVRETTADSDSASGSDSADPEKPVDPEKRPDASEHARGAESDSSSGIEDAAGTGTALASVRGRPDLHAVLATARKASAEIGITVCGPLEMSSEVRNTVAGMQTGALGGGDVYLHVEGFAW